MARVHEHRRLASLIWATLAGFMWLVASSSVVCAGRPAPQLIAATVETPPEIEMAIKRALADRNAGSPDATHYAITDIQSVERDGKTWRIISLAGLAGLRNGQQWNIEDHGVWFGLALARQQAGGAWTAGVQGSATFDDLLARVPPTPQTLALRRHVLGTAGRLTTQTIEARFPWQAGTSMLYGELGVHRNGFSTVVNGWQAVDFLSDGDTSAGHAPNMVYAAAPGVVDYVCRDNGGQVSFKIGNLFYTHFVDHADIYVGRAIAEGEALGALKTGTFTFECGYAWQDPGWFHLHWGFPDAAQLNVEGWTLSYTQAIANWVWRKSDALRLPGQGWLQAGADTAQVITPRAFLPVVAKPPLHEARVLWISRFDWCSAPLCDRARLEDLIHKAADARFNVVLFQTRAAGDAYHTPGLEP